MSDLNTRPSWFLAIHPTSASSSLPISAFLESSSSFNTGSQQADTPALEKARLLPG